MYTADLVFCIPIHINLIFGSNAAMLFQNNIIQTCSNQEVSVIEMRKALSYKLYILGLCNFVIIWKLYDKILIKNYCSYMD